MEPKDVQLTAAHDDALHELVDCWLDKYFPPEQADSLKENSTEILELVNGIRALTRTEVAYQITKSRTTP